MSRDSRALLREMMGQGYTREEAHAIINASIDSATPQKERALSPEKTPGKEGLPESTQRPAIPIGTAAKKALSMGILEP